MVRKPSKTQIMRIIATQSTHNPARQTSTEDVEESVPSVISASLLPELLNAADIELLSIIPETQHGRECR